MPRKAAIFIESKTIKAEKPAVAIITARIVGIDIRINYRNSLFAKYAANYPCGTPLLATWALPVMGVAAKAAIGATI